MSDPAYQHGPFEPSTAAGVAPNGRLRDPSVTSDQRTFAMFEHLSFFAWFVSVPVVVTLILWLIKKADSPFIDDHGRESLNMQISMLIYTVALIPLGFITCGIAWALSGVLILAAIIFTVMAAIAANRGEYYRYPAVIRFL